MEIPIEEILSPAVEILWDAIGAKKSIGGVNIKQLLTKQLYLALSEGHNESQGKGKALKTTNKDLKRLITDLMKLRRIALKMQSKERKILFYALLIAIATAIMDGGAVEKLWKEVTRNG